MRRKLCSWFWNLVEGMPLLEFCRLLQCGRFVPDIMFFNHVARTIEHFAPLSLPWPVEYLLAHHSPKHIFGGSRLPSLGTIGKSLVNWENKLRWRLALSEKPQNKWSFLQSKNSDTGPCDISVSNAMNEFFFEAKNAVYKEVLRIRRKAANFRWKFNNFYGVIRLALQYLKIGRYMCLQTDKDGGFCLISKDALQHETARILANKRQYSEIEVGSDFGRALVVDFVDVARECASLGPFSDTDRLQFLSSILQPARSSRSSNIISTLKYTVKSHKPPGEVEWRPLHSSVRTPLAGGMRFITFLLRPILLTLPHLLLNSFQVVQRLRTRYISSSARLIKIDIRDFFMEGEHAQFLEACSSAVPIEWKRCLRTLLAFILRTQYVRSPCFRDKLFQVKRGAGMGLLCSGDICDITFYKTVEETILPVLASWNVVDYFRFRDDIFAIVDGPISCVRGFVEALKANSCVWKLKVESISLHEVVFLDLRIFKGPRWAATRCLDITLNHKATAQKQVLACHSLHTPSTHLSWPQSLIYRVHKLCNSSQLRQEELERLKNMLTERCGFEHANLVFGLRQRHVPRSLRHDTKPIVSRLIIPYHREWEIGAVRACLRKVTDRYSEVFSKALGAPLKVSIGHTLQNRHLHIMLWNMEMQNTTVHGRRMGTVVDDPEY